MPYIEVDEIPEGATEADVVSRYDYDAVVAERDEYATQRDDAIAQIEGANSAMREAQAKYAGLVLGMGNKDTTGNGDVSKDRPKGATIGTLFKTGGK